MKHRPLAAAVAAFALAGAAHADTLVNIKGFGADGAGADIYSYPVAPGTIVSLFNPVLVDLPAGDYLLGNAWGRPGALYDTWNFQADAAGSWGSHFVAAEVLGGGQYRMLVDGVSLKEPTCKNHFCAWDTQAEARAAFLATPPFTMRLDHAATIAFASADYYLPDNLGGISLLITAAPVPEPATFGLLGLGLALLGARASRARRQS
ncbi:PEP-CTERM sorting domain-containing protein [Roseateles cellulosilyticus]|uniref:PEP-CTERM sorting domain-containing protein n=1 Tax=Pelomonas cellulosilytica TaxID=2906762 RepID=A0ABS8XMN9_9BURK|nr:PEP-CTERM sorting domain-containing protein [Pelomonas sp. P8]MCE4554049.1 PEP-CTERM sorting domain-containing protein [Pelomonas sp. P8]